MLLAETIQRQRAQQIRQDRLLAIVIHYGRLDKHRKEESYAEESKTRLQEMRKRQGEVTAAIANNAWK